MKKIAPAPSADRFSDEAVSAKTGKNWHQWFKLLDAAQAHAMNHTAIAAYLRDDLGCPNWWSQMVAVQYERERGLREKHQRPSGSYSVSASKTIAVPISKLFTAWEDAKIRRRWLPDGKLNIRKATANKSLRIACGDGATRLEANFYSRGDAKSQVAVEHLKLKNKTEALRMKKYWGEALARLQNLLERG